MNICRHFNLHIVNISSSNFGISLCWINILVQSFLSSVLPRLCLNKESCSTLIIFYPSTKGGFPPRSAKIRADKKRKNFHVYLLKKAGSAVLLNFFCHEIFNRLEWSVCLGWVFCLRCSRGDLKSA